MISSCSHALTILILHSLSLLFAIWKRQTAGMDSSFNRADIGRGKLTMQVTTNQARILCGECRAAQSVGFNTCASKRRQAWYH